MPNRPTAVAVAAAVVLVTGLASGCGSDTTPTSTSMSTDDAPTASTTDPTETAEPSTAPAAGPAIRMDTIHLNAPQGWKLEEPVVEWIQPARPGGVKDSISVADSFSMTPSDITLAKLARVRIRTSAGAFFAAGKTKILDPVDVAGVLMYHVSGPTLGNLGQGDVFGVVEQGHDVSVQFELSPDDYSPDERAELIDSVLASVSWHDNSLS